MMKAQQVIQRLPGIEAIDYYFADTLSAAHFDDSETLLWQQILMLLSWQLRQGHTCVSPEQIADKCWFTDPDVPGSGFTLPGVDELKRLIHKALDDQLVQATLVFEDNLLYTRRYFVFEQDVIAGIVSRQTMTVPDKHALARCHALWEHLFDCSQSGQQDWQQVAVAGALAQRFSVINGGPGTGKTYTVTRLLLALQAIAEKPQTIVLCAPTGKAAQRLSESVAQAREALNKKVDNSLLSGLPDDAVTLHRLLGLKQYGVATRYHQGEPIDADVVVVDEASMVDIGLMARLLRALRPETRLYLIGDADQLPAVESGNVLEALIHDEPNSAPEARGVPRTLREHIATLCPHLPLLAVNDDAVPWVHSLSLSQRFSGQLAEVAQAIRDGHHATLLEQSVRITAVPEQCPTDGVVSAPLPAQMAGLQRLVQDTISPLTQARSAEEALNAVARFRWLTPLRRGPLGTEGLNTLLGAQVRQAFDQPDAAFFQGQVVMVRQNNYAQQLFNGDVGVVWPDAAGTLKAWFETPDGSLRQLNLSRLPATETAFAMTVHKSQGAEFEHVILVVPPIQGQQSASLYHRGLLYTGLTRAKKACLILGDDDALKKMIASRDARFSGLRQRLHRERKRQ